MEISGKSTPLIRASRRGCEYETPAHGTIVERPSVRRAALLDSRPAVLGALPFVLLTLGLLTGVSFGAGPRDVAHQPPGAHPVVHGHTLVHRWVYVQANFQASGTVERVTGLLDRAAAAGYNGVVLSDVKFGRLDDGSLIDAYYTSLRTVLDHARALDITVIPATADFGYSEPILWHDPNLAEGLPVRDATYRAEGGRLVPDDETPVRLVNGDFETLPDAGHAFPGWAFQDAPGRATFVDRDVVHRGRASLRMVDLGTTNAPHGNGRIHQRLSVEPFNQYHVRVWVKTEDFNGGEARVLALGQNPSRTLQWNAVPVQPTQDWTRFDVTFNSLSHNEVLFYFGVWGGGSGTIWWDDGSIARAGPVNIIRRPGAPVRLTSADGGIVYDEGQDVAPIVDPEMGRAAGYPGTYDPWHPPPTLTLPAGSRIADGQQVRLSYYHTTTIYGWQVPASLTEPAVIDIVDGQLDSLRREFSAANAFSGWLFSHDEIRIHGWDEAPTYGDGSPGANLAGSFEQIYRRARANDPTATILVWSDMFDPYHNAAARDEPYYLVNGDWHGSWTGVPSDVVIVNWNHRPDRRRDSAAFFAERGHRQILAGYYDAAPGRFADRDWLRDLESVPKVRGVMYTQWTRGYDDLEAWADHVWGDAPWVTPTATPAATGTPPTAPPPTATPSVPPATPTPRATLYLPLTARADSIAADGMR